MFEEDVPLHEMQENNQEVRKERAPLMAEKGLCWVWAKGTQSRQNC